MITNTIGQLTELQANGEGYFTESYPTNFHHFYKRKVLVGTETAVMFKDVTAAEKTTIEAADAKWERPPQSFIDRWTAEVAKWGCYNEATGYFELNGLTDITYKQALQILDPMYRTLEFWGSSRNWAYVDLRRMPRTTVPFISDYLGTFPTISWCEGTEVIRLCGADESYPMSMKVTAGAASSILGATLTAILDRLVPTENVKFTFKDSSNGESYAPNLSTLYIYHTAYNVDCSSLPKLSMESVVYMVDNAANTTPITITLHPSVYARLTEELIAQAAEKQITFATTS